MGRESACARLHTGTQDMHTHGSKLPEALVRAPVKVGVVRWKAKDYGNGHVKL